MTSVPSRELARPRIPVARRLLASVVTAALVAATVHVTTIIVFIVASQFAAGAIEPFHQRFFPATVLLFILVFLLAAVGGFSNWYSALASGVVAGALAAVTASSFGISSSITSDVLGQLFATLLTVNLIFFVSAVIASVTIGRSIWARMANPRGRVAVNGKKIALVRVPANNLSEGLLTHIPRTLVDTELAEKQWDDYVTALLENGWSTVEVDPAPDHADSVFVEDTVVIFGDTAVITSPGAEERRGETTAVETSVATLGLVVERIELPGTLDGGDVLKVGSTVYVGRGGRTNAEGIRQLRVLLADRGYTVVAVPVTKVLHLKSGVTALPDGTVIGYPPLVDDPSIFDRFMAVPEETGVAVVVLAPDTVLMAASAPRSAELIADLGYRVITVDISEFEKLEGCVTCLSVRVR